MTTALDRFLYPQYEDNWDNVLLRQRILEVLTLGMCILDFGAGRGLLPHMNFRGKVARVCGVDADAAVLRNPYLDDARLCGPEGIPYPDASFDLVYSNNVLEHLADPAQVFNEIHRVLKPGGRFLFKTPNRRHYVPALASVTPQWFHRLANRLRGRKEEDTFPTHYRANDRKSLLHLAKECSFQVHSIEAIEGRPEYLRILPPTYLIGFLYERTVNSTPRLEPYRVLWLGTLKKLGTDVTFPGLMSTDALVGR